MRKVVVGRVFHIALLAALLSGVPEAVARDPVGVHLSGRLNKSVVAVGEPFVYEVEVYGLVADAEEAAEFRVELERALMPVDVEGLQLSRIDPGEAAIDRLRHGYLVTRVTRRFVFRTYIEGVVPIPELSFEWAGRRYRLGEAVVTAYRTSEAFHDAARAIVPVFVARKDPSRRRTYHRTGSGFFIRGDALVTSFHVVADARSVQILLPDGSRLESRSIWSIDPVRDVVVLHVDSSRTRSAGIKPLVLAGSAPYSPAGYEGVSDVVFTYGWPGGVRHSTAGLSYRSARLGFDRTWISGNGVRPGDSGGPLLNASGEVIGVITLGSSGDPGADILREDVCIANDPRPAIAQMSLALGTRSMKDVFQQEGFRHRPHVQAFRLMAMISRSERFDKSLIDALSSFESAISERKSDPGLHFMRGIVYRMLGTDEEADASFVDVLRIFDDFFPASYLLGLGHLQRREFSAAVPYFERTLRVDPYRHLAQYGLARARMGLHDYEGALELLQQVLTYDPLFAPALYESALCHLVLGQVADLTLASARLKRLSVRWGRRLDRVIRNPVLQPRRVSELPRAAVSAWATAE